MDNSIENCLLQAKQDLELHNFYEAFHRVATLYNQQPDDTLFDFLYSVFYEPNIAEMKRIFHENEMLLDSYPLIPKRQLLSPEENQMFVFPIDGIRASIYDKGSNTFSEITVNDSEIAETEDIILNNCFNEVQLQRCSTAAKPDFPAYFYYDNEALLSCLISVINMSEILKNGNVVILYHEEDLLKLPLLQKKQLLKKYMDDYKDDYLRTKLSGCRIVHMNGGLGNQVFQYIFGRFIELEIGVTVIYDDTELKTKDAVFNGYEIERIWGLHPKLLSNYLKPSAYRRLREKLEREEEVAGSCTHMEELLQRYIPEMQLIREFIEYKSAANWIHVPGNQYIPEITEGNGTIYYKGYWINRGWFEKIKEVIYKELTFPELIGENAIWAKKILSTDSVSVHIRRGDFLDINRQLSPEYYSKCIQKLTEVTSGEKSEYFLFSDDIPWCRDNLEVLGLGGKQERIHFIEGNTKENAYIDMHLMSLSKHMIIANSSFSYLALLLNKKVHYYFNPCTYRDKY